MIGRHDITFPSETACEVMEGIMRLLRVCWSDAIVENAETGEMLENHCEFVAVVPAELLIYRNAAARDSWKANGAIPENENLMVHVLRGDHSITVVVDDPDAPEMSLIIGSLRDHIFQDIFWMRAHAA